MSMPIHERHVSYLPEGEPPEWALPYSAAKDVITGLMFWAYFLVALSFFW